MVVVGDIEHAVGAAERNKKARARRRADARYGRKRRKHGGPILTHTPLDFVGVWRRRTRFQVTRESRGQMAIDVAVARAEAVGITVARVEAIDVAVARAEAIMSRCRERELTSFPPARASMTSVVR